MPNSPDEPVAPVLHHRGYVLRSAFQPIYSFAHQRLVGHEALLRATDAGGSPVSPQAMFERCNGLEERRLLDESCRSLHARTFSLGVESAQWLFLNVDASAFVSGPDASAAAAPMCEAVCRDGLQPSQVVIELLETALPDGPDFEAWTASLKQAGFILAVDDFGAGHSNFDRVFRLRPHIVKLDRSVVTRAAQDKSVRRVFSQMISLLHECGAQVLIEGVESAVEADVSLDSDADFVQGYYFGRPQPQLRRPQKPSREMVDVWGRSSERSVFESRAAARQVRPYVEALLLARRILESGRTLEEAYAAFLRLPDADLCYTLDGNGMQVGPRLFREVQPVATGSAPDQFAPLLDVTGARWSRRPYFRRALAAPGELQLTRPYPTMHSRRMNVTLSLCFTLRGQTRVLCGDKLWHPSDERTASEVEKCTGRTRGRVDVALEASATTGN